ncbi:MAG: efflux RND transporter periplasmic adaptor subunit [Bacteroidales bacterium]|nr:efflux RND transporter periplasmic adaptor subunit [Bacteroidales bacterium]
MKKFKRIAIVSLIAILFIGTFAYLYKRSRPKPDRFEEVIPAMADISRSTVVTGKIVPRDEINIKPQISGIISEILKEAGEQIKEGEIIAKVKVIPEMGSLSSAQSRVRLSELNLQQAKTNLDREKALYDKDLVSAEEYEQVRQAYRQAKEEHDAAQETLEVVRDGVSKSNASSSSTLIRSTINGLILDVPVKVGNSVIQSNTFNDGTTIATVADMHDLIFDGNIDETEVGKLSEGMPVRITIGALQDLSFDAILEYISPKAVESNGTKQFEIKAAVSIPDGHTIRSGYSANAEIVLQRAEQVISIPESAVEFKNDSTFVYIQEENGTYTRRAITTGISDGINIEVREGLSTGDKVRGSKIFEIR